LQKQPSRRSKSPPGTAVAIRSLDDETLDLETVLASSNDNDRQPPPAVFSADPDRELERKLRRNPDDADAKVDVGSDQSMDASDPPSVVAPGGNEPAPSSSSPDESADRSGATD
jgi:hypothetical protein